MAIVAKWGSGVVIGLERGNVDRLVAGKPFHKNLAEFGLPPMDVFIVFGETQADIVSMLEDHIGPDTDIQDHRNRKKN